MLYSAVHLLKLSIKKGTYLLTYIEMTLTGILFLVCSLPVVQVLNKVFPLSFKFIHKISIQEKFLYFQIASRAGYNTFGGRIRPAGRRLCIPALHYQAHHATKSNPFILQSDLVHSKQNPGQLISLVHFRS